MAPPFPVRDSSLPLLSTFIPATEDEVRKLVMSSATKSCDLDSVSTWLLKECLHKLLSIVTSIVNTSLLTSTVPPDLKHAYVKPLLKKPGLDSEILKNYRPVSNLTFISKLVEKVVAARIDHHFQTNGLMCERQSAYRKSHSTETALLKVTADVLEALDSGHTCILVLLDLSAAFDTLDHEILIKRLETTFGITGNALSWFVSYLSDRFQSVTIDGRVSSPQRLVYGVPQGSVLGPKLYSAYVKPLGEGLQQSGVPSHFYADDTQLHRVFNPSVPGAQGLAVSVLEDVICKIKSWMASNRLKLNAEKTEVMLLNSKFKPPAPPVSLNIDGEVVKSQPKVKNLGVILDNNMTMEQHITHVCRSAYAQLCTIARICRYLTPEAISSCSS